MTNEGIDRRAPSTVSAAIGPMPLARKRDLLREERDLLLRRFDPLVAPEPYASPELEYALPIGDANRKVLMAHLMSYPGDQGVDLFRQSPSLRDVSDNAATHRSLDRIYIGTMPHEEHRGSPEYKWSRLFMENFRNASAARNRLRIVKQIFADFIAARHGAVNALSIAAGSSRGLLEVAADLGDRAQNVTIRMTDASRNALSDGRHLAQRLGVKATVEFRRSHFHTLERYLADYSPDFTEIVGLLDYVPDQAAIALLAQVRQAKPHDGAVLFSNIAPNDEQDFVHTIVGWPPMIYRCTDEVQALAREAGYERIRSFQEPLGVYNLVLAT